MILREWRATIVKVNGRIKIFSIITEFVRDKDLIVEIDHGESGFLGKRIEEWTKFAKSLTKDTMIRMIYEWDPSKESHEIRPAVAEQRKPFKPWSPVTKDHLYRSRQKIDRLRKGDQRKRPRVTRREADSKADSKQNKLYGQ